MKSARWLLLGVLAPALLGGACGSGSMPEPAECHKAAPLATPRANSLSPSRGLDQVYLSTVESGINRLQQLRQRQRSEYPSRTFSRDAEFRTSFAEYADDSVCTAMNLRDLRPASGRFSDYDETLDTALSAFIEHMQFGREAVRKRNVSEYREWYDAIDARLDGVVRAAAARGR